MQVGCGILVLHTWNVYSNTTRGELRGTNYIGPIDSVKGITEC